MLEQRRYLVLKARWNELRLRKRPVQILDDIVALDMNVAVMDENRNQTARIDAQIPLRQVLVPADIDLVRFPIQPFEGKENTQLLRTGRKVCVANVEPMPVEHFTGLNVFIRKFDHSRLPSVRLCRRDQFAGLIERVRRTQYVAVGPHEDGLKSDLGEPAFDRRIVHRLDAFGRQVRT